MRELVQKLVTEASFDAQGALIQPGQIGAFDPERLSGKEPHIHDVADFTPVQVEQSALGPTGPNPTQPQQIPPDAVQSAGGAYVRPGVQLVAERTLDADQRLLGRIEIGDTTEGDIQEQLAEARAETGRLRAELEQVRQSRETAGRTALASVGMPGQGDAALSTVMDTGSTNAGLADGTVAEVTKDLGTKTDEQLAALQAAERDGKKRAGVLNAIQDELDARKENGEK